MTKARQLADLGNAYDDGALSNRNLIINGAMQVAQRGTSVSSQTANAYKTVDRFYTNASGATYNQSQQAVTVGGETGLPLQFSKFLRHQVTTGNNWSQIYHKIEDVTLVPTGTVTLSFYAKGTSPNAGLSLIAWQNFGSGGSSEVTVSISPTITLTSTWQRFTVNITVPSITGKTVGTGSHFYFGIGQGGSTSTNAWTLDITGVQLEVGDTATPFEHRSYGDELAKCQRYFELLDYSGSVGNAISNSTQWGGTTDQWGNIMYKYPKRATPSGSVSGSVIIYGKGNISTATTPTLQYISKVGLGIRVQPSSFTSDVGFIGNSSNFKLSVDAEL